MKLIKSYEKGATVEFTRDELGLIGVGFALAGISGAIPMDSNTARIAGDLSDILEKLAPKKPQLKQ